METRERNVSGVGIRFIFTAETPEEIGVLDRYARLHHTETSHHSGGGVTRITVILPENEGRQLFHLR